MWSLIWLANALLLPDVIDEFVRNDLRHRRIHASLVNEAL